jgi:hypothetical protein
LSRISTPVRKVDVTPDGPNPPQCHERDVTHFAMSGDGAM